MEASTAELASLSNLSDSQIDLSEMPEELDWSGATVIRQ